VEEAEASDDSGESGASWAGEEDGRLLSASPSCSGESGWDEGEGEETEEAEAAVGDGDCALTEGGIFSMDMPVTVLAEEGDEAAEGGERRCSAERKCEEVEMDDSSGDERLLLPAEAAGRGDACGLASLAAAFSSACSPGEIGMLFIAASQPVRERHSPGAQQLTPTMACTPQGSSAAQDDVWKETAWAKCAA